MKEKLIQEARNEANQCIVDYVNCVFVGQYGNDMLLRHNALFGRLADALEKCEKESEVESNAIP